MKLKPILPILCAALAAGFAPSALGANGPAYYLDVNGTTPGFGDPNGETIDGSQTMWTTDPTGVAPTVALPSWYDGSNFHPYQLTFGYPGTTGTSNSTFTLTGQGLIAGVVFNAPCTATLGSLTVFDFLGSEIWSVPTGSTFIVAVADGQNFGWSGGVSAQGGGTININCDDFGRNGDFFVQDMTNGTVNFMGQYFSTSPAQSNYELRNGTLNFATAASVGQLGGPGGSSRYFKISGGTLDNTSGSSITLNLAGATCQIAGNFAFAGSSSLNFGTSTVDLGTVTPTITVSNNTLEFDGALTDSAGLTMAGAGTLLLTAANTYSGNTTISAGTLALSGGGSIGSSPLISIAAGATFDVSAAGWSGSGSQNLAPASTSGTGVVNAGSQSVTLNSGDGLSFQAIGGGSASMGEINVSGASALLNLNNNTVTINVSGSKLGTTTNTLVTVAGTLVGAANPVPSIAGLGLTDGTGAQIISTGGSPGSLVLIVTNSPVGSQITTTTVALTTGASSEVYGGQLSFTATVTGASTTPSGSVTFKDGANNLATVSLANGTPPHATATYTEYTTLKVGGSPHSITASYLGDSTHNLSSSSASPVAQTITVKQLTYSGLTTVTAPYNGTNVATLGGTPMLPTAEAPGTGSISDGIPYSGDSVTTGGVATGVLAAKNAGAQPVTVIGVTLAGTDAGNYTLLQQTGLVQNVSPKVLTVTGLVITNPPPALAGTASFPGFEIPGPGTGNDGYPYTNESVSLTGTPMGTLATNSAEFNLVVDVSGLSLTGAGSSNYSLQEPVLFGPTQDGPAYYLDVNGTTPGFGDPTGLTINGSDSSWTTDPTGTNSTVSLPYWYDGTTHPIQLTFGYPGTTGISNSTFTVNAGGQLIAGVVFNVPCTATLTAFTVFNYMAPSEWYVPTNCTFNLAVPDGQNWAFGTTLMQGGGTINFNCDDIGRNAGYFIQDMANGTVNFMGQYNSTSPSQASYELRNGTLNFATAASAGQLGGPGSPRSFKLSGGALDNTSGSGMTLNLGLANIQIDGNFAFDGSSSLNLGTSAVDLGMVTPTITISNNTLEIDGVVSDTAGLTKAGAGTLLLTAANTYTGNTTVNGGILDIAQASLATNSTITVASGATLKLDFAVTNTVNNLVLNGASQSAGVYNAANSSPYIAGTGNLLVLAVPLATNITYSVAGNQRNQLVLNWPSGQGWLLQSNSIGLGNPNGWFTVTGATPPYTNSINPSTPAVFYRLKH